MVNSEFVNRCSLFEIPKGILNAEIVNGLLEYGVGEVVFRQGKG